MYGRVYVYVRESVFACVWQVLNVRKTCVNFRTSLQATIFRNDSKEKPINRNERKTHAAAFKIDVSK